MTAHAYRSATGSADGGAPQRAGSIRALREALGHLRGAPPGNLLERATYELCHRCGFDRAVISSVEASRIRVLAMHARGDPSLAGRFLSFASHEEPEMTRLVLESEMIRRRGPLLVRDAQDDPHAIRAWVSFTGTAAYVAAPIMSSGGVVGFIHADRHPESSFPVDESDRDLLWAFAEGLAVILERGHLLERLALLADRLEQVAGEATAPLVMSLAGHGATPGSPGNDAHRAQKADAMKRQSLGDLTAREEQVISLMADGRTNADIAAELAIADATVKSHVKRILRKLGAANRAEAVSRYLRAHAGDGVGTNRPGWVRPRDRSFTGSRTSVLP